MGSKAPQPPPPESIGVTQPTSPLPPRVPTEQKKAAVAAPIRELVKKCDEIARLTSERDTLQARIAELEAENAKLRSGEAFVGEAVRPRNPAVSLRPDQFHEYEPHWVEIAGEGVLRLNCEPKGHVQNYGDWRRFRYTGPTTAPLPSEPEQNLSPEQESALQSKCVEALARVPNDFIDRLVAGEFDGPPDESCSKLKDSDATLKKPAEDFKADDPPEDTTPLPHLVNGDYSREMLICICEAGVVPHEKWMNRDTPEAQAKLGLCWVMLKAGCKFRVTEPDDQFDNRSCVTDEKTIWLYVQWDSFSTFDHGGPGEEEHFYLPTPQRLRERIGRDWY